MSCDVMNLDSIRINHREQRTPAIFSVVLSAILNYSAVGAFIKIKKNEYNCDGCLFNVDFKYQNGSLVVTKCEDLCNIAF